MTVKNCASSASWMKPGSETYHYSKRRKKHSIRPSHFNEVRLKRRKLCRLEFISKILYFSHLGTEGCLRVDCRNRQQKKPGNIYVMFLILTKIPFKKCLGPICVFSQLLPLVKPMNDFSGKLSVSTLSKYPLKYSWRSQYPGSNPYRCIMFRTNYCGRNNQRIFKVNSKCTENFANHQSIIGNQFCV